MDRADPKADTAGEAANAQEMDALASMLERLPADEAAVLRQRFGIDCDEISERELGEQLGITRVRLQAMRSRALDRLRRDPLSERLRETSSSPLAGRCDHIRPNVTIEKVASAANATQLAGDGAVAGNIAGYWFLISHPQPTAPLTVRLADGADGQLQPLSMVLENATGERAAQLIEWAARLPLADMSACRQEH